jgi:MFS family permease
MKTPFFYGWIIIPVAWLVYGLGISPSYYSFGQFSNAFIEDLGLERSQYGLIFGIFVFLYSGVGPLVGIAQSRIGLRAVMTGGSLIAAIGFLIMSRAENVTTAIIGFSILGGAGVGFSTIIPCQTLGSNWFLKRRARAIAIIFTAGGIVGMLVPKVDQWVLTNFSWREGWLMVAATSFFVAIMCAIFVRNTPEDVGQHRDGITPGDSLDPSDTTAPAAITADGWTAHQAIRTPQFALIVLAASAYAVPWGVIIPHGKLHLGDLGIEANAITTIFSSMIFISIFGRLSASLGDFVKPQVVLGTSLLIEVTGVAGILYAQNSLMAMGAGLLVGIGFGAAYISIPVVFADYFGRQAFATTSGTRILITGIFNALGPFLAGAAFDQFESYTLAFLTLIAMGLAGALAAFTCPHPGHPPNTIP